MKTILTFYGTWKFITVFTRARHAPHEESTSSHFYVTLPPTSLHTFEVISSLQDFPTKMLHRQGQEFSHLHIVQTGSGAHLASYPMGTGGSLPGGKAAGA
jgi:hypothetical protein